MKNLFPLSIVFFVLLFISCGDDGPNVKCDQAGPPTFSSGPAVIHGASSMDIVFSINQTAVIYLVIYNVDQGNITPEDLKSLAMNNNTPGLIESRQVITLSCSDVSKGDVTLTTEGLPHSTTLYAYIVAESNSEDEILQDQVKKFQVNMDDQQPTLTFQSVAENREVLYLVSTPEQQLKYPSNEKYPAIIFLGGNGETTTQGNINLIKNGTLPQFLDKGGSIPFYVFSPQHIQNNWNEDMLNEMVEEAKANYPIDPDRVHMTGISGGGIGTWRYAINYPEQLASVIPISGDGNDGQACTMVNVFAWSFHNDPDATVATSGSVDMTNALNACNPGPPATAKITLFEDAGHNCWRRVYDQNHQDWGLTNVPVVDIYEWMLDKTRQ